MGLLNLLKPKKDSEVINQLTERQLPSSSFSRAAETSQIDGAENSIADGQKDKGLTSPKKDNFPDVPEEIFVEYQIPNRKPSMETYEQTQAANNLDTLFQYLEQNLEKKGYEDALTNPDTSYRDEHIRYIQNELELIISKIKSYYAGALRSVDLHIETRKRGGMMELVDELLTEKATLEDELATVNMIETQARTGNGLTENLFLSYKRGFSNGLAQITYNTILSRKQNNS